MAKGLRTKNTRSITSFRNLVMTLSEIIGQHHIPLITNAMHPRSLIYADAVHYELVKKTLHSIYRANRCYHLNATVKFFPTFDALGKIQGELFASDTTDIDQVHLIQHMGEVAAEFFKTHNSFPSGLEIESNSPSIANNVKLFVN